MNEKIVPDVALIAREMTSRSQVGIILSRFLGLNLMSKLKLMINNLPFLPLLARMDFAVGIKVLCELEILKLSESEKLGRVILHNQMADMALALDNKRMMTYFFFLSKKYGYLPGIKTYNIGAMIKFLSSIPTIPSELIIYVPNNIKNVVVTEYIKISNLSFVGQL
ncbi:MAG: hypothetical protein WC841_01755 [Candidatus Shapirobacteria bacterium]|jgi:hypothetical protein